MLLVVCSVTQSCPRHCDPMECSMPDFSELGNFPFYPYTFLIQRQDDQLRIGRLIFVVIVSALVVHLSEQITYPISQPNEEICCIVKTMVFPVVIYRCESWTIKEGWELKNCCFQTVVLEKTPKSPLDCKKIKPVQPVNPKGNQPWVFIGRTDAEGEAPLL